MISACSTHLPCWNGRLRCSTNATRRRLSPRRFSNDRLSGGQFEETRRDSKRLSLRGSRRNSLRETHYKRLSKRLTANVTPRACKSLETTNSIMAAINYVRAYKHNDSKQRRRENSIRSSPHTGRIGRRSICQSAKRLGSESFSLVLELCAENCHIRISREIQTRESNGRIKTSSLHPESN